MYSSSGQGAEVETRTSWAHSMCELRATAVWYMLHLDPGVASEGRELRGLANLKHRGGTCCPESWLQVSKAYQLGTCTGICDLFLLSSASSLPAVTASGGSGG